jgi:acyl-CoA thioesterase-1
MTKKKILFSIFFLISIGLIVYLFASQDKKITNYPPKNKTVVAFGDSLVEGVGSTPGNDFISVVERSLGINIINNGTSGDTTTSALGRANNVIQLEPGVVIILLGGNDVLRRVQKEETFENLGKIIESFQEAGAVVILLGVQGGIIFDGYEKFYKDLSRKYGTAYVSNVLDGLIGNQKYMYDGIHPNDQGYAIIAGRVSPVLEKLLK